MKRQRSNVVTLIEPQFMISNKLAIHCNLQKESAEAGCGKDFGGDITDDGTGIKIYYTRPPMLPKLLDVERQD